jgi:hypothetical protein
MINAKTHHHTTRRYEGGSYPMRDRRGDLSSRVIGGLAALAAGYLARKLITVGWKRVTGKEPPAHPEDPQVALTEALGWAVVTGVGMEAARLIATRTTAKRLHANRAEPSG